MLKRNVNLSIRLILSSFFSNKGNIFILSIFFLILFVINVTKNEKVKARNQSTKSGLYGTLTP